MWVFSNIDLKTPFIVSIQPALSDGSRSVEHNEQRNSNKYDYGIRNLHGVTRSLPPPSMIQLIYPSKVHYPTATNGLNKAVTSPKQYTQNRI